MYTCEFSITLIGRDGYSIGTATAGLAFVPAVGLTLGTQSPDGSVEVAVVAWRGGTHLGVTLATLMTCGIRSSPRTRADMRRDFEAAVAHLALAWAWQDGPRRADAANEDTR